MADEEGSGGRWPEFDTGQIPITQRPEGPPSGLLRNLPRGMVSLTPPDARSFAR